MSSEVIAASSSRRRAGSCGSLGRQFCDQPLESVVDVLHLLAAQGVDVGGAGDALDERDDLAAIDAAAGSSKPAERARPNTLRICRSNGSISTRHAEG